MRLSTVILPIHRWHEGGRERWRRAEELGFHTAYTYDHLSWRAFRDGPWFGALPTLTAAAAATERLRLGTLVTSPNFRHPVTLAKELITLDDISAGRITLGIGAGGNGFDATTLLRSGEVPWTPRQRADRFGEFVTLLDALLREPAGKSYEGDFYSATEARNLPGCVQRPRLPFAVAATGPRGLALAARQGQAWVTTGDPKLYEAGSAAESLDALRRQVDGLARACAEAGRDVAELDKVLLTGFTPEFNPALASDGGRPLDSVDAFVDFAGRHAELGFTEIVIHAPVPADGPGFDAAVPDEKLFEEIAVRGAAQLAG
ncbi:alkanesulfonate monooxygenase SsuD/methylene tetrahydromethanopterin reductase-like flavin-dependent oxidoreductase (luciferase family) [Streptomyces sp. KhCrAH-43]|uniref:LLM class flavin-dependent oxidoreductase n=1 Tax=Streptomyces TaxID=1883 RepID=UPI000562EDFF|nr:MULTISPECIES: LLM class flavin-dependent oxidoreductase [unclassified Streptomyces]MYS33901.1 LLM class flavin-dependent oxidoreductase [Streptomyces sp. SID4920]MYX70320.1 LLM class flavin-dependent oxidoreductase [Streptomyces sp. SID8373]RAJ60871.1 alkanesulfonate monooxygenase SsuD/methylene tetrahydromethanopterin reductase-like flavin-dependent oxidoreductase (luciferase family) [Streptomyces sp. KhCrAH-43]